MFLGTHRFKIDKKGRLSVPSAWRTTLTNQGFAGVILFRSFKYDALEARGMSWMADMAKRVSQLDEFSQEYDDWQTIFADARQLAFDPEGRIILPQDLCAFAGITEDASLVGGNAGFQIWSPQTYETRYLEARNRLARDGRTLPPAREGA